MKGLLIKDFHLLKVQRNFFLLIAVIAIGFIVSSNGNNGFISYAIGFFCFVSSLFSISTISYDEFDNGNPFLFSLPFTRKNYVLEKYCFGIIIGFSFWILSNALTFVYLLFRGFSISEDRLVSSLILIPFFLLILAVMLPLTLKFGGERSRYAIIGIFGGILLLGYVSANIIKILPMDLSGVFAFLLSLSTGTMIAGVAVITLVLLLLSLKISISIVDRKEF